MKQYTERELDKKIHAFITSKTDQFPELARIKPDTIDHVMANGAKSSLLRDVFSIKLKPVFK
jgi:hypothetical protein